MSIVALTGAMIHVIMDANTYPIPIIIVGISCLIGALISAKFTNQCEIKKLNHVVGIILMILGIVTIVLKLL